jgi:hypothetical protein
MQLEWDLLLLAGSTPQYVTYMVEFKLVRVCSRNAPLVSSCRCFISCARMSNRASWAYWRRVEEWRRVE